MLVHELLAARPNPVNCLMLQGLIAEIWSSFSFCWEVWQSLLFVFAGRFGGLWVD